MKRKRSVPLTFQELDDSLQGNTRVPLGTWSNLANHRKALDIVRKRIGADINVTKWYGVTLDLLYRMKLGGLLASKYDHSPQSFLKANMPEEEWDQLLPWEFKSTPQNYWDDAANHREALDIVRKRIGADIHVTKWYGVTLHLLYGMKLGGLLASKYGDSPQSFFKANMSEEEWAKLDVTKFNFVSAQELWSISMIKDHPDFVLLGADALDRKRVTVGERRFRWDLVILHVPSGRIGVLEVDGEQHFHGLEWREINERDKEKLRIMKTDFPPCCTKIDFLARISYRQRRYGYTAIQDLLDCVHTSQSSFMCLPDDAQMYSEAGLPQRFDGAPPHF